MKLKTLILSVILMMATQAFAQTIGKYSKYYDQRELLFEVLPTSENDIIFLGNSITDGCEWSELFNNPNCKNRGISADVIPCVLNRLETVTKGQPEIIFLMIGTNDLDWGFSNDSIAMGIRTIVRRIKNESPRTRIIVQSILPTNNCYGMYEGHTKRYTDVPKVNALVKAMAEEEDVEYLDLYSRFTNDEGKLNPAFSNDGLHLNGAGYLLWKAIVEEELEPLPRPNTKSRVPIWIDFGMGLNVANCFDKGTIPFNYYGLGINGGVGLTFEWRRCHLQTESRMFFNGLLDPTGYAFALDSRVEFLYRVSSTRRNRLHWWAGGNIQTFVDLKEISSLMNASMGFTSFENVCAEGMLQYDFAFIKGGEHNLLSTYCKLSLPLMGIAIRPGFSYMDNYTNDINLANSLLSDYETFAKMFPGVSTDLGLYLNLLNGNRIGLNYRWDYLTTGHKGAYRYDNAFHSVNLNFMFKLN